MDKIKVIKTEEEYKKALLAIDALMVIDPDPNSEEGEKLSLLATLVEDYEARELPGSLPDPIEAILFRMDQQGLTPQDLEVYLGSASRVSEVLSRKRTLSLAMMRALEKGLGIPAKVLLNDSSYSVTEPSVDWERFPWKEMEKRGYFGSSQVIVDNLEKVISDFLSSIKNQHQLSFDLLRKTNFTRKTNQYALRVWATSVLKQAESLRFKSDFNPEVITPAFTRELAKLSSREKSPLLAQAFLKKHGIALIIEPHFPQTYLDGATLLANSNHPVIGITIRHNRLDNFWFTLMHELAHLFLHRNINIDFFDEELEKEDHAANPIEVEADNWAAEALVPEYKWENSPAKRLPTAMAAISLASELGVHPAIVAGAMRFKGHNYRYLNNLVKEATVRQYFPDKIWN